eukprot:1313015-Amorphochlora_amoeboformis.AAC.2
MIVVHTFFLFADVLPESPFTYEDYATVTCNLGQSTCVASCGPERGRYSRSSWPGSEHAPARDSPSSS